MQTAEDSADTPEGEQRHWQVMHGKIPQGNVGCGLETGKGIHDYAGCNDPDACLHGTEGLQPLLQATDCSSSLAGHRLAPCISAPQLGSSTLPSVPTESLSNWIYAGEVNPLHEKIQWKEHSPQHAFITEPGYSSWAGSGLLVCPEPLQQTAAGSGIKYCIIKHPHVSQED